MKKTAAFILVLSMCFALSACRNTDFVNLSSFIDYYNTLCEEESQLDFSSFIVDQKDNKQTASFFPYGSYKITVRLENDEFKQIEETRIVLRKTDKNANRIVLTQEDLKNYLEACNKTVFAFSNCEITEVPKAVLPSSVSALAEETEKTAESQEYYFIYYSNSLVSEIIIRNNKLKQTETTKKPENKEPFAQMTETRKNTVPHK